jgi:hypothetical protein
MSKIFICFCFFTLILFGCSKEDVPKSIVLDGNFSGHIDYKGTSYWTSISFDENNYAEWPSGGAYYQKSIECLTVGSYSLDANSVTFTLDSFKYSQHQNPCESDMLLPGKYSVTYLLEPDSVVFEKGTGTDRIVYYLGK